MISMYAEYSGRTLYVCLSTDNNADDFKGAKNGDIMYHMGTGKRYVYNDVDKAFHELPEEGGGGGGTKTALVKVKNKRSGSLTFTYLTAVDNLPGLFGNQQSLSQNGQGNFPNMAIQDGRFTLRCGFVPTHVAYNGTDLQIQQENNFVSVPYVGSDYVYEVLFN